MIIDNTIINNIIKNFNLLGGFFSLFDLFSFVGLLFYRNLILLLTYIFFVEKNKLYINISK